MKEEYRKRTYQLHLRDLPESIQQQASCFRVSASVEIWHNSRQICDGWLDQKDMRNSLSSLRLLRHMLVVYSHSSRKAIGSETEADRLTLQNSGLSRELALVDTA
jgi:hypothetical protein